MTKSKWLVVGLLLFVVATFAISAIGWGISPEFSFMESLSLTVIVEEIIAIYLGLPLLIYWLLNS